MPAGATGTLSVSLSHVNVTDQGLFGLFVSDQVNISNASIHLDVSHSSFTGNGTDALDFDGLRIDEAGLDNIVANIEHHAGDTDRVCGSRQPRIDLAPAGQSHDPIAPHLHAASKLLIFGDFCAWLGRECRPLEG